MKSFYQFLFESEKFETMYDIDAYTQGQSSPNSYKELLAFFNKIPLLPSILNGFTPQPGRFDILLLTKGDIKYRVDFDFVRKFMLVYNTENDTSEDILYKVYPFVELINSTDSETKDINTDNKQEENK
jgi:hypothetical protein